MKAYQLHYSICAPDEAYELYKQIIEISSDSPEAGYAKQQIQILGKHVPTPEELVASRQQEDTIETKSGLIDCEFCGNAIKPDVTYCKFCGIKIRG